jgi:hypothetical protein
LRDTSTAARSLQVPYEAVGSQRQRRETAMALVVRMIIKDCRWSSKWARAWAGRLMMGAPSIQELHMFNRFAASCPVGQVWVVAVLSSVSNFD